MAGDAQYFHATLYEFSNAARQEVIKRFNAKIRDSAARCTYSADDHCFTLVCPPGPIGPHADETLSEIISSYITEALRVAAESETPPEITRFPESSCDVEVDDEPLKYREPEGSDELLLGEAPRLSKMLHVVNAEGAVSLRFFTLDALPQGLSERTLTPRAMTRKRYMENGSTLRSVTASEWLFNGRVGQPLSALSTNEETALLDMAPFARLEGTAKLQEQPFTITPWRHAGTAVSTSQWLQGLGQIEQGDPEEAQRIVPKEVRRMIVADRSHQNPALGRLRVPAGGPNIQHASDSDSASESESDEKEPVDAGAGFSSLIRRTVAGDSDSEDSDQESSSSNSIGAAGTKQSFKHLLQAEPSSKPSHSRSVSQSQSKIRHEPDQIGLQSRSARRRIPDKEPMQTPLQRGQRPFPSTGSEFGGREDFASYGPQWATYRNGTVQADPRIMAEWQHQNPTSTSALSGDVSEATIRSYQDDAPQVAGQPPWARRIVQNRPPKGAALIDVAAPGTTKVQLPPAQPFAPMAAPSGHKTVHDTLGDDDDLVERIEPSSVPKGSSKRFTMRQKAQKKKSKGRSMGKAAGAKAQLPVPSPPPLPRPAKTPAPVVAQPAPTIIDRIAKFLADLKQTCPSVVLEMHFGQMLSMVEDRRGMLGVGAAAELASKVGADGLHFIPAMTSRLADARFMLNLFQNQAAITGQTFYEIHVKDTAGIQTRVSVSCEPLRTVAVLRDDDVVGMIAMHFPIRIWDAVLKVIEADGVDASQVPDHFDDFLQSMSCCGGEETGRPTSPSFIAKVPIDYLTIERVYAKREWSRDLPGRGRFIVTEVQDMFIQSLGEPDANLELTVLQSRDSMTEAHRLWFEARIEGLEDAKEISDIAEKVVSEIDGVGFNNRGYVRHAPLVEQNSRREMGFQGGKNQW